MAPGFTIIDNDTVMGRLPEIPLPAVKVLLVLARRSNGKRGCWPSIESIGRDTGLCVRAVRRAIRDLVGLGLVAISKRPGTSTIYHLMGADIGCTPGKQVSTSDESTPLTSDERGGGTSDESTPLTSDERGTRTIEQEPFNKKKRTTPKARGCAATVVSIPTELDSEIFREAWKRWTAHRTEIKKKLTPTTTAAQLKKLAGWGEARAVAAIEQSITAGWTGIFEERINSNGRKNGFPTGPGQRHAGTPSRIGVF